jgi:FixJ family two-component response regulator
MTTAQGLAILCLEDDVHVGRTVAAALAQHRVDVIDRVAVARERLAEQQYAAWVLDVRVLDGTGIELLEERRGLGDATPALVMTGLDERWIANRAQELGAQFLYKPFTRAALHLFLTRASTTPRAPADVETAAVRLSQRYRLPRREHEIVDALTRGVARTDLASELGVSENTMKTYVRRLLERTMHDSLDDVLRTVLRES